MNTDYSLVETVDGKLYSQMKTNLKITMLNELGQEIFMNDADKTQSLTSDNYPVEMVSYPIGKRNKCIKSLTLKHSSKNYGFDPYNAYQDEVIVY